jgi:hypothetical protein
MYVKILLKMNKYNTYHNRTLNISVSFYEATWHNIPKNSFHFHVLFVIVMMEISLHITNKNLFYVTRYTNTYMPLCTSDIINVLHIFRLLAYSRIHFKF